MRKDILYRIYEIISIYQNSFNMEGYCNNCSYNCCKGGIWLCNGENRLIKKNIKVFNSYFIDNFSKSIEGDYVNLVNDLDCPYYTQNKCIDYANRPFICRIVPVDIVRKENNGQYEYLWVLRKYCLLYQKNKIRIDEVIEQLIEMTEKINSLLDKKFLANINNIYDIYTSISMKAINEDYVFINNLIVGGESDKKENFKL